MATSNRSAQFTKLHKVLKKHYAPVSSNPDRPVLEHLIFACCLEDARYEQAEEALASVQEAFFDWNEVRVSSVRELAEVMARLPDPPAAATRLKKSLQHVFEDSYTFDLESLRKKNLGPAEEDLRKIGGVTRFMVSYVVQSALGGHSIPIDAGVARAFEVLDLASEKDLESGAVPGLERAIAKNKGIEFGSLLHQFGADITDDPFSEKVRNILLEVDPECKTRLPRRTPVKKKPKEEQEAGGEEKKVPEAAAEAEATSGKKKTAAAKVAKKAAPQKKPAATAKPPKTKAEKKKAAPPKKKPSASREAPEPAPAKKKSAEKISKRKPR